MENERLYTTDIMYNVCLTQDIPDLIMVIEYYLTNYFLNAFRLSLVFLYLR